MPNKTLRLILGDQLNAEHSWFKTKDKNVHYLICELHQEQTYVTHHIQKVQAFFLAMSNFANALEKSGHNVIHKTLDDTTDASLQEIIKRQTEELSCTRFEYQQPDEFRLDKDLRELTGELNIEVNKVSTEHFFVEHNELKDYFKPGTAHRMEAFYRKMRQRHNLLMEGDEPVGGKWNYDKSNRNKFKKSDIPQIPEPLTFDDNENSRQVITKRISNHKIKTIGSSEHDWAWPTSRSQAKSLLSFFLERCLSQFGQFQDAMTCENDSENRTLWSLYHCRLSFALNTKMISPAFVVNRAIEEYENREDISIEQIEGFVRQILGWREFVRGIYWANMPDYKSKNELSAGNNLPDFFWTGKTKMKCLQHSIQQSLDYAYAHHIQRLMIIGNFALITHTDPDQVDEWYLGIYIDAIEWVELPNTRGMSQFADGGMLASKAYAASGNYINGMSDYCKNCHYKVKEKTGDEACPFNALYWGFMAKHEENFKKNPRQSMVYRNWEKKSEQERQALLNRSEWLIKNLDKI